MARTPLLPKNVGWYIEKGSPYFETAQLFTARIKDTGKEISPQSHRRNLLTHG
jgi:hypothetical protein